MGKPGVMADILKIPITFGANCVGVKPQPKSNELEKNRDYKDGSNANEGEDQ